MKKTYIIEVKTVEKPYKQVVFQLAENELEAIDKVQEQFTKKLNKEIIDIKIINK